MPRQCLQRLFNFFDVNQDGVIHPEEWVDSMTLCAEFFEHHSDQSIQKMPLGSSFPSDVVAESMVLACFRPLFFVHDNEV